ncbi:MAG: glutamine synthetase family protein [Bacteroidetes bacterium]|nr:glutamine synthetase family protein [Bacteroidota bacterium]MBU1115557.1 glutamine synthetase family protein [Bacteroidota bacterium]MBU1797713.1 glutamine synthetase family protein [Bacteroidota bacterium]
MREYEVALNQNSLVKYLRKPAIEFTRHDIIRYIEENEIEQVNFQFVNENGKLKTLNFVITSRAYLESILSTGERVDGSSLFSYIDASTSDLYVIPRFKTAFVNPFSEIPTINLFCSFYTKEGQPLASAPENILRTASRRFTKATGLKIKALGELEYYIIADNDVNKDYPAQDQKGYHASTPFAKFEFIRTEAIKLLAKCGAKIKYAHSEVGNFTTEDKYYEQHEIEYNAVDIDETADQLVLGKWILRNLAYKYGVDISFAPKISVGKAGSGLHIHYMIVDEQDNNLMIDNDKLSEIAIKTIAGILDKSKSLTAFGNTIPTSYLRLVPHQEAPTNICWGETNRSALIRIPLGWILKTEMIKNANPYEIADVPYIPGKQTAEFRVPDGSADIYHLLAGMVMAMQHGIELPNSLEVAESLRIEENLFANDALAENLKHLPTSCAESADELEKEIDFFNTDNVFPLGTLERFVKILRSYNDNNLSEKLFQKHDEIKELVNKYVHYA